MQIKAWAAAAVARLNNLTHDEQMILGPFGDIAKHEGSLKRFFDHIGLPDSEVAAAGNLIEAILAHYRRPDDAYDLAMLDRDYFSYEPAFPRIFEVARLVKRQKAAERRAANRKTSKV